MLSDIRLNSRNSVLEGADIVGRCPGGGRLPDIPLTAEAREVR